MQVNELKRSTSGYNQGRIQDLKKEGAQVARGRVFRHIKANLRDFLKNFAQKRVGVRPLRPYLDPRLLITFNMPDISQTMPNRLTNTIKNTFCFM